jgi:SAM-dependent MidA family methyltransferase
LNQLRRKIADEIGAQGVISFARFMDLALYCPVYGYYETQKETIGRHGDYYTSVSVGSLFGELLAFQFAHWLAEDGPQLVEAGAHAGYMAQDILRWFREHRPDLFERLEYWMIEPSTRRRQWQEATLAEFAGRVRWAAEVGGVEGPSSSGTPGRIRGVIFSNELLDSFPVHRFGWDAQEKTTFEWGVRLEGTEFAWAKMPGSDSGLSGPTIGQSLDAAGAHSGERQVAGIRKFPPELLAVLPQGYAFEICPRAIAWWREAARALSCGRLLTFDYGLSETQRWTPERMRGTCRAYFQHRLTTNLLANPGEQDLTAHVDFASIQSAGEEMGLKTEAIESQAQFLTRIASRIWNGETGFGNWTAAKTRQFQTLTHPNHLGTAFKVLLQTATPANADYAPWRRSRRSS